MPLPTYYEHAASEHLVRIRCQSYDDACTSGRYLLRSLVMGYCRNGIWLLDSKLRH